MVLLDFNVIPHVNMLLIYGEIALANMDYSRRTENHVLRFQHMTSLLRSKTQQLINSVAVDSFGTIRIGICVVGKIINLTD